MRSSRIRHLARRLIESTGARSLSTEDLAFVHRRLLPEELAVWQRMQVMDQVHSVGVARRLLVQAPHCDRIEVAAALLHDVGKAMSSLGVASRVAATILGPRRKSWRMYLDHEQLGSQMCRESGLDPRLCDLVGGAGDPDEVALLRAADDL